MSDKFVIRSAGPKDAAAILALVRELAEFEQMLDEVRATAADFAHELARPHPVVHVLLAGQGGQVAGFALYFFNFSTFVGRKGIYLEDLYVRAAWRRQGIGIALLAELARIAALEDCSRMEWSVLDWNEPAIRFYESLGAKGLDQWRQFRLTQPAIAALSAR